MTDDLLLTLDGLRFGVEKSLRYHQRRRAHYERLHRYLMLGVLLSGSAAFGDVFGEPKWFGLISATLGALDLVFSFSMRVRDHEILHRRFTDLARSMTRTAAPTAADVQRWTDARQEIETEEPPVYWAVEASCYNEVSIAWGREKHGLVKLTTWQKAMMNWFTFDKVEMPLAQPPPPPSASTGATVTQ